MPKNAKLGNQQKYLKYAKVHTKLAHKNGNSSGWVSCHFH